SQATGRKGLTAESILRCALLKQHRQLSYEELAFCLLDSVSCRTFARLGGGWVPKKRVLQASISSITGVTWEQVHLHILPSARERKVETGRMQRIDSTVTETSLHPPGGSQLMRDGVRVMVRLLESAHTLCPPAVPLAWRGHLRRAGKRARRIVHTRGQEQKARLYRDLIQVTRNSLGYLKQAELTLSAVDVLNQSRYLRWQAEVDHYTPLLLKVTDQTERRVSKGEKVPAEEKVFSLFEAHTGIIIKRARDIQYGHKINLSSGRGGLILDGVIESGNPAGSERLIPMLERPIEHYGKAPRQVAADGGYASTGNLDQAKALSVQDTACHKKPGLKIEDMAKSPWVYRKLRNFRAGIEACI
ncbi:MAG TPA: ISNCY family transposase, partial [Chromatiaceae bacterium]|nr:ISNCY family transposase [Chromatiaceae bacterium]